MESWPRAAGGNCESPMFRDHNRNVKSMFRQAAGLQWRMLRGRYPLLFGVLSVCAAGALTAHSAPAEPAELPRTAAEESGYRATSRYADAAGFCRRLAEASPLVRSAELGTTFEGRRLPLLILADPPVATPQAAARSGKLVVFAFGNIHAGEVDGKEALMMLARDLLLDSRGRRIPHPPLLKELVVVVAPVLNADGNERLGKTNRPGQNGPEETGTRANAQGLDLNRDFTKLESPEVRAVVRFVRQWKPAIVIDTHTTNGSYHRYMITYDGPRNPAAPAGLVALAGEFLPAVSRRMDAAGPYRSFFYGNFAAEHTRWEPYPAQPRFGVQYLGLRNCLGILSESYSYAPFRDRCLASLGFVRGCLEGAAARRKEIRGALRLGSRPAGNEVPLVQRMAPLPQPVTVLGWEEERRNGRSFPTDRPRDYAVEYLGRCETVVSVRRPYAYLLPAEETRAAANLQRHGIEVEELTRDAAVPAEAYRLDRVSQAPTPFQGHRLTSVEVTPVAETRRLPRGTLVVSTRQPLGTLASYLLEPQSEDGLCAWNFFDHALKEGGTFPVVRLPRRAELRTRRAQPLPETE